MHIPYEQLFRKLELVLMSKVEEFHLQNYKKITKEQIWFFCIDKKWKKTPVDQIPIHQLVSTILAVTSADLLVYEQLKQYKTSTYDVTLNDEEMQLLLAPLLQKPSI